MLFFGFDLAECRNLGGRGARSMSRLTFVEGFYVDILPLNSFVSPLNPFDRRWCSFIHAQGRN